MKMRILEPHLATREARRGLLRRATPYWLPLRRGLALGYRCGLTEGTWLVKVCEPGLRKQARLGLADDLAKADGGRVLSFETARATALAWAPKPGAKTAQFKQVLFNPTTVGAVVLSYLTYLEKEKLSTAWKKSWAMANHYILHHPIAKIRVRNLKYSDIDGWRNEIAERIPMSRSRKPREEVRLPLDESAETFERKRSRQCTANRVLALLKAALNRAKATGTADRDPFWTLTDGAAWRQVRLYAGVYRSRKRFLSIQEQRDLVAACPDGLRQLVQGALATGARFGELATMRVRDVYLVSATITLDTSKTKVTRRIPILPESMEFFRRLVQGKSQEAFLFLRSDGNPPPLPLPSKGRRTTRGHCPADVLRAVHVGSSEERRQTAEATGNPHPGLPPRRAPGSSEAGGHSHRPPRREPPAGGHGNPSASGLREIPGTD